MAEKVGRREIYPPVPPPFLEDRCNVATKRELERIVNDITHPNQIFLTKPNSSHRYNLRSKPGSVSEVRNAKTYQLVYSKSCKTPFMICTDFLHTFFLLE